MIRVCVADDQALIRSGIKALLELFEGISVVAQAEDGESAIRMVRKHHPDVLLVDVRMPNGTGIDVVRTLRNENILPPTLLLTTFDDDAALIAGVKNGARGYLLKGVTPEILIDAIRTVAEGKSYLYAPVARQNQPEAQAKEPRLNDLTTREREILRLMVSGISNREISTALSLTEGTVRNHVSNIFSKMGVNDRTRAVLQALAHGFQ